MHKYLCGVALVGLIAAAAPAGATTITYTATDAGSPVTDGFKFDFTVSNDTLGSPIENFTIEFAFDDFVAVLDGFVHPGATPTAPASWDPPFVASPVFVCSPGDTDPLCKVPGLYDALAFDPTDAIGPGASLGGFTVWAQLASTAPTTPEGYLTVPDMLYFTINDPVTFDIIDEGYATLFVPQPPDGGGGVPPVPLPATFPLLLGALGWLGLGGLRRRRSTTA